MRALRLLLVAGLCSCSTQTDITNAWRDPSYHAGPMRSLLVVGANLSETDRRTVEDVFARELQKRGIAAEPSYRAFPDEKPSRDDIRGDLEGGRWDGALMTAMRGVSEETHWMPGGSYGFYDYYSTYAWGYAYPVSDEYVHFESTLWDRRGRLVWSITTQTVNPSSQRDFAQSLVGTVIDALVGQRLIGVAPEAPISRR